LYLSHLVFRAVSLRKWTGGPPAPADTVPARINGFQRQVSPVPPAVRPLPDELELLYLHLYSMRNFSDVKDRLIGSMSSESAEPAPTAAPAGTGACGHRREGALGGNRRGKQRDWRGVLWSSSAVNPAAVHPKLAALANADGPVGGRLRQQRLRLAAASPFECRRLTNG
jgi:hypothetical protein